MFFKVVLCLLRQMGSDGLCQSATEHVLFLLEHDSPIDQWRACTYLNRLHSACDCSTAFKERCKKLLQGVARQKICKLASQSAKKTLAVYA